MVLALTAAAGPPPSPSHVSSLPTVSDVARKVAAAGAKPAANSTSAAPSSTAKPAASSPLGAAAKPATQGALGGGFGATTTASSTFPPLDATTPASPFGAAVNPAAGPCGNTDEPVVIVWDGLTEEEREGAMRWMSTAKPWVLWKQGDSFSTIKKSESTVEGKL